MGEQVAARLNGRIAQLVRAARLVSVRSGRVQLEALS